MTYDEAVKLAKAWTKSTDVAGDGWRAVIYVLLQRVENLESHLESLNNAYERVRDENEALSLDLGLKRDESK